MSRRISPTGGPAPCWDAKTAGSSGVKSHYQCVRTCGFAFHVDRFHLLILPFSDFQEKALLLRGAPGIVHSGEQAGMGLCGQGYGWENIKAVKQVFEAYMWREMED